MVGRCGKGRITHLLYAYKPQSIDDLLSLLQYELKKEQAQQYGQTILWSIARMLGGQDYHVPKPIDFYDMFENKIERDKRSADDIVQIIRKKLQE